MPTRFMQSYLGVDLTTPSGRALVEERYRSLRRQVPIIYLLGLVNLSAMEVAAGRPLTIGLNLPTFILTGALIRLRAWFGSGSGKDATHEAMVARMSQTVVFAAAVCLGVCARCLYLLQVGDAASHMAVILFGGLTAIGIAYGLTALPAAGRIPLFLIIGPISVAAALSKEREFTGAAFGLVVVAALTLRLLSAHNRHFTNVISSRSAIAGERKRVAQAHQEALVAATTDFLTGLPNRRAFETALETAAANRQGRFSIAILDLNRFKAVNDTFGHAIGDSLLEEVAARLTRAIRNRGVVARLGGDEFGMLFHKTYRAEDARAIGSEILDHVNGSAMLMGRELVISASCGVTTSRTDNDQSPSRLMAEADLALYQAKDHPGAGAILFEPLMEAPRRRRAEIERALQLPSLKEHLRLVFQPIFDLGNGQVIALEALARWTDPQLGEVAPSEFVPLAEQLGLIDRINSHLMTMAFEAARAWPEGVRLSFNLSTIQLCSPGSAKAVLRALEVSSLEAHRLQFEVTETALLADFERARENLTVLKDAGSTIVLDDFGAGYASIGYLRQLRFDQIKLDGGLVTAAQHSEEGKRLLRSVIGLCEILGVSSVAEHVESAELLALVLELGCAAAQGFWLEKPLSADEVSSLYNSPPGGVLPLFSSRAA
jgi:diguanylate cyclase (GGDEF)-like protein